MHLFEKPIFTDEKRLKQIIINLINNAIRFTSNGGIIVKFTKNQINSCQNEYLEVAVIDTGEGMPLSILTKLSSEFTSRNTNQFVANN